MLNALWTSVLAITLVLSETVRNLNGLWTIGLYASSESLRNVIARRLKDEPYEFSMGSWWAELKYGLHRWWSMTRGDFKECAANIRVAWRNR